MTKIFLALGGNAILGSKEKGTFKEQFKNIRNISGQIVQLIMDGHQVLITHGNGPQVGALLLQQDESKNIAPEQPLDVLDAMTQGQIGYMIQLALQNEMKRNDIKKSVVTLINMVEVDESDPAFDDPTKPVGPFYTYKEARKLALLKEWNIKKVLENRKDGYRHVVPSPTPIRNNEVDVVRLLLENGVIVIASGGGGIPVSAGKGALKGVEAVIDKDMAGELLAEEVGCDVLMLLTDIEKVKLNFGKDDETDLDILTISEAEDYMSKGHFPPGSMGPKIRAATRFISRGGSLAVISSIDKIMESYEGKTGTRIIK